jgi:hypothetical protein
MSEQGWIQLALIGSATVVLWAAINAVSKVCHRIFDNEALQHLLRLYDNRDIPESSNRPAGE